MERNRYLALNKFGNTTGFNATRNPRDNMDAVIDYLYGITHQNCKSYPPDHLKLKGDMAFGMEKQFENEARMALRLSNFLSAFLQVNMNLFFIQSKIRLYFNFLQNICFVIDKLN